MRKNRAKILDRSLSWIREHPFANNLDVPNEFLEEWIFQEDPEELEPSGFYLTIFAFGFLQNLVLRSPGPLGTMHKLSASALLENFPMWQMKLGLVKVHRLTDIHVEPLPLFFNAPDEQVRYWPMRSKSDASSTLQDGSSMEEGNSD